MTMTVGQRLKQLREKAGLSQVDLAAKLNVSKQNLYKYENDIITNIPSDKIEEAASILNVSPSYIMGWTKFDDRCSGKEADDNDERLSKLAANILKFHGDQKRLIDNYGQLSDINKKKVVNYSDNLLAIQKMEEEQYHLMPDAAHERTDIDTEELSAKHDDDIMDDPNF
jgi:transcriptional regulator with XRE-family HTH domain